MFRGLPRGSVVSGHRAAGWRPLRQTAGEGVFRAEGCMASATALGPDKREAVPGLCGISRARCTLLTLLRAWVMMGPLAKDRPGATSSSVGGPAVKPEVASPRGQEVPWAGPHRGPGCRCPSLCNLFERGLSLNTTPFPWAHAHLLRPESRNSPAGQGLGEGQKGQGQEAQG